MERMGRVRRSLTRAVFLGVLLAGMVTAVAGAAPFVYVGTGSTTGIDPSIFQFAANPATDVFPSDLAPAGNGPSMVAMSPDGGSAYVTNANDGTISQYDVDVATGQLVPKGAPTVTTGRQPTSIVIAGAYAYALNGSSSILEYSIDPATGALIALAPANVSTTDTPRDIAVSGTHVYVIGDTGSGFMVDMYDIGSGGQLSPTGTPIAAGVFPAEIVISPDGASAYVINDATSNSNPGTVSEYDVDPSTGQLTPKGSASVATGAEPTSMAFSADGRYAYVTNEHDLTVSAYTVDSGGELTATGTGATGVSGRGIATSGTSVYVTGFSQSAQTYAVTSYTIGSNGTLTVAGTNVTGQSPTAITVHGDSAYVIDANPFVTEYDIAPTTGQLSPKGTTATTAPQLVPISGMAVSPDASSLYTVNSDSPGTVVRYGIDPATGALTDEGTAGIAGDDPTGIAISPSGQFAYIANWSDQNVAEYAIDASSGQLSTVGDMPTVAHPGGIALAPGGHTAYVTDATANTISQYAVDPATGRLSTSPTSTVSTGARPTGIVVAPNGQYAYVANSNNGTVWEYTVDPATGQFTYAGTTTLAHPLDAQNIALSPDGRALYVLGNSANGPVSEFAVDPTTGALTATNPPWVGIDAQPEALAIAEPEALTVTTSGTGSGTVTSLAAGINCGSVCAHSFQYGVPVTLTATPAAGSQFAGWSGGGCTGTAPTCTVTLSAAGAVSAAFSPAPSAAGAGTGGKSGSSGTHPTGGPSAHATIGRVKVSGRTVTVVVVCTGATCKGSATLRVTETLRGKTLVGVAARARRKQVVVGAVTASVTAGHSKTLRLTLNATGRRLLARYHRLASQLTVTATAAKPLHRTVTLRK